MSKEIDDKIDKLIEESKEAGTSPERKTEIMSEVKKLITQNLAEGPQLSSIKEQIAENQIKNKKRPGSPTPEDRTSAQIRKGNELQSEFRKDLKKIADKAKRIRPQQEFKKDTSWKIKAEAEAKAAKAEAAEAESEEDKENKSRNTGPK